MTEEETQTFMLETVEGLMSLLQMLVQDDPEVLVRRWGMHAVPTAPQPDPGNG